MDVACTCALWPIPGRAESEKWGGVRSGLPRGRLDGSVECVKKSRPFRFAVRALRSLLAVAGAAAVVLAALQFTSLPWKAYSRLAEDGVGESEGWTPTHILVLGGSGVPGESALMRLWYTAEAAREWPEAPVWMALPCDGDAAAQAYADELALRGVEAERCAPQACGRNTREQAVALVQDLESEGSTRVLVVTSPEHVRRACATIRRAAQEAGAAVEVRGKPAFNLSVDEPPPGEAQVETEVAEESAPVADLGSGQVLRYNIWSNARYTLDATREYVALLYYRMRGWI